ncbi:MAG: hypothetical protein RLY21_39 [Planctomycetota bacterium]|jgi:hypothetical protein
MQLLPAILAQARGTSIDIGAQASAFLDALFTPAGFAVAVFGTATLGVLLVSRSGTRLIAAFTIFLLSMMRTDSKWVDNTLIQPFETIRNYSRPIALALLIIVAIRSLAFSRVGRQKMLMTPAALFLVYQLLFISMIGVFVDPVRAGFAVICYLAALTAFTFGLPALMDEEQDSQSLLKVFALAGLMFIGANLLQLGGGYYNAVLQGRLAGIAGNAQQMAAVCCAFIAVGCFFFASSESGSWRKWFAGVALGILGLFVLWSGSRTGAVCATVTVLAFFRARVGRLALLGIVGGGTFAVAVSVYSDSLDIVERFFRGGDTRSEVWASAIADFVDSPIFGQLPITADDGINFVESTYLRTLALMGSIGGIVLFTVMFSWVSSAVRVWRMGRAVPSLALHADFFIAATAFFVLANAAEGFMMGVLTFFIPFIYAIFAMGAYVLDAGEREIEAQDEQQDELLLTDDGADDHPDSDPGPHPGVETVRSTSGGAAR